MRNVKIKANIKQKKWAREIVEWLIIYVCVHWTLISILIPHDVPSLIAPSVTCSPRHYQPVQTWVELCLITIIQASEYPVLLAEGHWDKGASHCLRNILFDPNKTLKAKCEYNLCSFKFLIRHLI